MSPRAAAPVSVRQATWRDFGALVVVQLHGLALIKRLRGIVIVATALSTGGVVAITVVTGAPASVVATAATATIAAMALGSMAFMALLTVLLTAVWLAWPAVRMFVAEHDGRIEAMLTIRRASRRRLSAANHARRVRPRPHDVATILRRGVVTDLIEEAEREGLTLVLTAASAQLVPLYLADVEGLALATDWRTRAGWRHRLVRPPSTSSTTLR